MSKSIRYGLWTIAVYAIIGGVFFITRPQPQTLMEVLIGSPYWSAFFRLFPFLVGFVLLVTGYSAIKGDRSQIIPAIVHGVVLAFYIGIII
jgi:uncharacterized membrane protein